MRYTILFVLVVLTACTGIPQTPNPTATSQAVLTTVVTPTGLPNTSTAPSPDTPVPPTEAPTATWTATPSPTAARPPESFQSPAAFPDPEQYHWNTIITGLERPVGIVHAGDNSGRLFILEQAGRIRIFDENQLLEQPFLDIVDRVGSQGNEQGLLGLAFHPDFQNNGYFYINYTDTQGDTVIARYQVSGDQSNLADPASESVLLSIPQPYPNHNGGATVFGPDGYLYLGLGDGGSAGDPLETAENPASLLGKILRIDVDQGDPYQSPADNLFIEGQRPEVWAYGLRNPWRFSFDRLTGDLYIGDVGQNQWEEIDFLPAGSPAGADFGWDFWEGNHVYEGQPPAGAVHLKPIAEYSHQVGCSVTGGVVYRGADLPAWNGIYLFSDYCSGNIWGLFRNKQGFWQQSMLFENVGNIASFGEDERGEIYLADLGGIILKFEAK